MAPLANSNAPIASRTSEFSSLPGTKIDTLATELTQARINPQISPTACREAISKQAHDSHNAQSDSSPDPSPQKTDMELEARAQRAYKAMKGGVTGWGTDEAELFKALEGLSPDEVQRLQTIYKDRFNSDLKSDITSELSGEELTRGLLLLECNHLQSKVVALHSAMDGVGTDEEAIKDILQNLTQAERALLLRQYRETYGEGLQDALHGELSEDEYREYVAILEGRAEVACAARIHAALAGMGTNEEAIYAELEGKSAEEIKNIAAEYQRMYGASLEQELESDLSGTEKARGFAALRADSRQLAVEKLKMAMDGAGTDEEAINQILGSLSDADRSAVITRYKQDTGRDLEADLRGELSGPELEKSLALLRNGKLTDAEKIYFATEGIGTDEETIKNTLQGKTKEQIDAITEEYRRRFGDDLEDVLRSELGGRDEFEIGQYLKGAPQTLDEEFARLEEKIEFAKSGIANGLCDALSSDDERMEEQYRRAKEAYERARRDGTVTKEEEQEIRRLLRYAGDDAELYQSVKESAADTAASAAAVAAATAVVVATGGAATPLIVAAAAATGGASYVAAKGAVLGDAYDGQDGVRDFALAATEAAVTVVTAGGGQVAKEAVKQSGRHAASSLWATVARKASSEIGRETVGGIAGGVVEETAKEDTWQHGFAVGIGRVGMSAATGAAGAAVGFKIGKGIEKGVGKTLELVPKAGRSSVAERAADGAIGKLPAINSRPHGSSPIDHRQSSLGGRSITEELKDLPVSQRRTLGRGGADLHPDMRDSSVSRIHATVEKLPHGRYRVVDGIEPSGNGIYVTRKGSVVPFHEGMEVRPGDVLTLGDRQFRVPDPAQARSHEELWQIQRLKERGQLIVGRGRGSDVNIPDDSVSRMHAILTRDRDGRIHLYDAKPSGNGVDYYDSTRRVWSRVSQHVDLPAGTFIRLGEHGQPIHLPGPRACHINGSGGEHYLPDSISSLAHIDGRSRYHTVSGVRVHGVGKSEEIAQVAQLLAELTPDNRQLIKDIKLAPLGHTVHPDGSILPNSLLSAKAGGIVVVSPDALTDTNALRKRIESALEQNSKFQRARELVNIHQERPYTQWAASAAKKIEDSRFGVDNGRVFLANRWLIKHDSPINGGIGHRWIGEEQFSGRFWSRLRGDINFGIVVDSKRDPYLAEAIGSFLTSPEVKNALRLPAGVREEYLSKIVLRNAKHNMRYDLGCDRQALKSLGHELESLRKRPFTTVPLGEYLKNGTGVCYHQALYAGAVMEEMQRRGLLDRDIKLSIDTNILKKGGHAWLRISLPRSIGKGELVIDPAQNYCGSIWGRHRWAYHRPGEMPNDTLGLGVVVS